MDIASEYDRTHVVSAAAAYDFGRGWHAAARVFAYTGRPYTPLAGVPPRPVVPYDGARLDGFFRLDARVEKAWRLGDRDRIAVVVEGVNVTLGKEEVSVDCGGAAAGANAAGLRTQAAGPLAPCTPDTVGPITIPSVGVEGTFR